MQVFTFFCIISSLSLPCRPPLFLRPTEASSQQHRITQVHNQEPKKMTWFCGNRRKYHSKSKVSSIQYPRDDNDNSDPVNNAKPFAVVLQDFEASVSDELSVNRGQVVEMLYRDSNWVYVRNFDLRCGYVPLNFCYGMDQIFSGGQHWNANEVQGSTSRAESPPQTRPRPKSINLGSFIRQSGSQSSVEVHNIEPRVITPQEPQHQLRQANSVVVASPSQQQAPQPPLRSSTPVTPGGQSAAAQRLETPDSTPPMARSNRRLSSLQPSMEYVAVDGAESTILEEPRYVERPHNNTIATAEGTAVAMGTAATASLYNRSRPPRMPVRRSVSMNEGARLSCRSNVVPLVQRTNPIQRSMSYQEAVRSAGQDPYRLTAGHNRTLMHRDAPLNPRLQQGHMTPPQRVSPLNLRRQQQLQQQQGGHMTRQYNCNGERGQGASDYDPSDDVFLPEPKKPVGIYRCIQTYRPKYQGELSVKEGELVILLEFGRGDWAWVLTSMNQEGLMPRHHLVRYNPRLGVGGPGTRATGEGRGGGGGGGGVVRRNSSSDAATQTELVIEGCVRHVSGASSASAGPTAYSASSSSSVTTPQTTPPLTLRAKRLRTRTRTRAREVVSRERGEERYVVASPATQAKEHSPKWFEDVDSLERPPTRTRPTQLDCTVQTTPPIKNRRRPNPISTVATATPQSIKSADLGNRLANPTALVTPKPVKSADYTGPASAEFWFNSLSSTASTLSHQAQPTLTALKDYDPPPNAKNCLKLSKGDVLNAQPHMHYPKGWMWVWHAKQRSFGYVPQSHVGYMYPINKGERSRRNTEEDAV